MSIKIYKPITLHDWSTARALIQEYLNWLDLDISHQNVDDELANLKDKFSEDGGGFFLASLNNVPIGCVGFWKFSDTECEMKRLYVSPKSQGHGIGKQLIHAVIEEARKQKYKTLLLDTIPKMVTAQQIYSRMGFVDTYVYRRNIIPDTRYLNLTL